MKTRAQSQAPESPAPSQKKGKLALSEKKGKLALSKKKGKPSPSEKKGKPSVSKRRSPTGGVLANEQKKYTSSVVEIRPRKWKKRKIWIGGLKSPEDAKQVADVVFHYTGKQPVHSKDVVREYPSITCMGTVPGTPKKLSTTEECAEYVLAIAKDEFELQKEDFINQLKGVLRRPEFAFLPADHGVVPPKRDDVDPAALSPKGDDVEQVVVPPKGDDVEEEDIPAMEDDENAARARRMSSTGVPAAVLSRSVSVAAGLNIPSGVHSFQANIPGFDVLPGDRDSNLQSVGQSISLIPLPESQDEESDQEPWWKQFLDDPIAALNPHCCI